MTATLTDLFCGAGGSALGATALDDVELTMAANHWATAVETHQANFPHADHDCADVSQVDPRRYPATTLLWASPECTWQSGARGRRRDDAVGPDLFGGGAPAAAGVRSRATMFDVLRFAEQHRYAGIVVENVVEAFTRWELRRAWLAGFGDLGYAWRVVSLNSMHAPAVAAPRAPQSRDRAYLVAWRRGAPAPDLEPRPRAWCGPCGARVGAVQWWKRPSSSSGSGPGPVGKYRAQYLYRCPICAAVVEPEVVPAAAVIDWTRPGQRIGDRARPLSPKTLARITAGLVRYAAAPFVTNHRGGPGDHRTVSLGRDLPTVTASGNHLGLVVPSGGTWNDTATSTEEPMRTRTARDTDALVVPYYGTGRARPATEPAPTMTTVDSAGVAFIAELRGGGSSARDVTAPLATVTASGTHHMLVRHNTPRGDPGQMCTPATEPARTITTTGHQSLVGWPTDPASAASPASTEPAAAPRVEDCTFRMLTVREIQAAMAFPPGYRLVGTQKERVRQLGNGVTPPAAEFLIRALLTALDTSSRTVGGGR